MCCAHNVLVVEVRALSLQRVLLVNDTVLLLCCARAGVWLFAVRKPCTPVVCTDAFDPHTGPVDAAETQQMTCQNTIRFQLQQCEGAVHQRVLDSCAQRQPVITS